MNIFDDIDEFFRYLTKISKKTENISIATYNLWVGITHDGRTYNTPAYDFLDSIRDKDVRIILGVPLLFCECKDCIEKRKNLIVRYKKTSEHFDEFDWRYSNTSHMKMYRIGTKTFIGGFNLSSSNMYDMMSSVGNSTDYLDIFNKIYSECTRNLNDVI